MRDRIGVAISTTGDPHRIAFLETSARHWATALGEGDSIFVTVDGTADDAERARMAVREWTPWVYRVGQVDDPTRYRDDRLGVAVNKNTGLELLMDAGFKNLFLSDDDTYPLYPQSLTKHTDLPLAHSMVCWGASRLSRADGPYATWTWPRGVMLYVQRKVVETVGGMDERFGPGGHEHVEWSGRIHNAGFTPYPFMSPASYATRTGRGASALWHGEDMRRPGESVQTHQQRRKSLTSVRRVGADWDHITRIMDEMAGASHYVPFRAHENGRASATLCSDTTSRGADT